MSLTSKCKPTNSHVGDSSAGHPDAEWLQYVVNIPPSSSGSKRDGLFVSRNTDMVKMHEVNHHSVVSVGFSSSSAVTATSDCEGALVLHNGLYSRSNCIHSFGPHDAKRYQVKLLLSIVVKVARKVQVVDFKICMARRE